MSEEKDMPQDVSQNAKVIKRLKSDMAHKLENNLQITNREILWGMLMLTETLESIQRSSEDVIADEVRAMFNMLRQRGLHGVMQVIKVDDMNVLIEITRQK